ncbi:hypothetical protein [Chitinophaga sp. XS-30]|nr:hypothetical protein [Chitinophaga sp. XS-30]
MVRYHGPVVVFEGVPIPAARDDDFHPDISFNVIGIPADPYRQG